MVGLSKFETIVERTIEKRIADRIDQKIDEYFGSLLELTRGPVVQVHAAVTRNGLTKAVRKTKRSQLADMRKNEQVFFKAPRGVTISRWESRWCSTRTQMQQKTGFKWRINRDHEQGGVWITRTV